MIKAVIFDLDDTLISEKSYILSGYRHVARILGKEYKLEEGKILGELIELCNEGFRQVFNRWFDKKSIAYTAEMIKALVREYHEHNPEIEFYNDVIVFLNELRKLKIKTGIITDGDSNMQRCKLRTIEADKYFDKIIVTDELGPNYNKPNPYAFELMQQFFSIEYAEMMYVGDNPMKDFYVASKLPITTVRINRGGVYKDEAYLHNIKEQYKVNSLREIVVLLGPYVEPIGSKPRNV